jgi:TonB family protein
MCIGGRGFIALALPWAFMASAQSPTPVTVLTRTMAYEEGLGARLTRDPVTVFSLGFDCADWPGGARLAGHATNCLEGDERTAVADASRLQGVVLVGALERALALDLVSRARGALVPVLALGGVHAGPEVLLAVEGPRLFIGEEALRRLKARFPAAVLRLATIMAGESMPPTLPEDAEAPTPEDSNEAPAYPEEARSRGREGVVVLRVGVSVRGTVQAVELVKGEEPFGSAAAAAARRWRYRPATLDGQPLATSLIVRVPFRLSSDARSFSR